MRPAAAALLFLTLTVSLTADDLVTRDGTVYHGYKVLGHDDGYLTILYADGGGKIPLKDLPDDLQKQYGYDPAKAAAFVQNDEAADRQQRQEVAQAQTGGQAAPPDLETAPVIPPAEAPAPTDVARTEPVDNPASAPPVSPNSGLDLNDDPLAHGDLSRPDEDDRGSGRVVDSYGDDTVWVSYIDLQGLRHEEMRQRRELCMESERWVVTTDGRGVQHYELRERRAPERLFVPQTQFHHDPFAPQGPSTGAHPTAFNGNRPPSDNHPHPVVPPRPVPPRPITPPTH
jgi:hypothetical protein